MLLHSLLRPAVAAGLLAASLLSSCEEKAPAPATLPGRWNLASLHVLTKDANGQITADYSLAGKSGDYLLLTNDQYQEYTDGKLSVDLPYTRAANTLTLKAAVEHLNQRRDIRTLEASKLVLTYQSPVVILGQSAELEATYSR